MSKLSLVKVSEQNGEGDRPERKKNQELPRNPEHHNEVSSTT